MKNIVFVLLSIILFISCEQHKPSSEFYVSGVSSPVVSLNGIWEINTAPKNKFWKQKDIDSNWKEIRVPGEVMMQGFSIKHDEPFVYKKNIHIPADFKDKTIKLQFDGVYSYARVWVNGNFIREHSGGFTRWDCDITPFVKPGEDVMLIVEVTDKADEISYASGYAKHQIGGILRGVSLLALPSNYVQDITVETDLDDEFQNAELIISGKTKNISSDSKITLELLDVDHQPIKLTNASLNIRNKTSFQIKNKINLPLKWDAEHPNLYSLIVSLFDGDELLWQKMHPVGFREIEITENKLYVNGKETKLRGACRHDIHPLLGRVSTPDYEIKDVLLAKEANMNFIRTSHYPPTENFLKLCDEYGLYVEDESAVCFVGSHRTKDYRPGASQNDSTYTKVYLSQLEEMVNNHKNHPSIIMWSIGNENSFGFNFQKSYDWVKANDHTRPVIFSYPGNVPDSIKNYDLLSMHYPGISGNMEQYGIKIKKFGHDQLPVIFDEWAHVACYNNFTIKEDPNIRNFWGQSLDSMWQKTFEANGGLGGAIWGMIDETFMLPDSLEGYNKWWAKIDEKVIPAEFTGHTIGYGEWGIMDTWRRKKPEFWNTKKAYSPVKILKTDFEYFSKENPVSILVSNRFDHTNINELTIKLRYDGKERIINSPDIDPHKEGILLIPMEQWNADKEIELTFLNKKNELIDAYNLRLKSDKKTNIESTERIKIEETDKQLRLICKNNTIIIFEKNTGLISQIQKASDSFNLSGPYVNLRTKGKSVMYSYHQINDACINWKLIDFNFKEKEKQVVVHISGKYDQLISTKFELTINSNGKIVVEYLVDNVPKEYIREIGLRFDMEDVIDSISWKRDGYWSYYPSEHLSSLQGKAPLYTNSPSTYRTEPKKGWTMDNKSFFYDGTKDELTKEHLTNLAKSTKENTTEYHLIQDNKTIFSVFKNANCRISKSIDKIQLFANNKIDYVDLSWGNYQRNISMEGEYNGKVEFHINP